MRLINFLMSLLLILAASSSFAQKISIENAVKKFPVTDEGAILTFDYPVYNKSNDTLFLTLPEVDCSCTEFINTFDYLPPHSTQKITISFNTKYKIGWQEIQLLLTFSDKKGYTEQIPVVFKGRVKASKETKKLYKQQKKTSR